jgi:uncharacterized membrane protein YhaH (DUF805 family)
MSLCGKCRRKPWPYAIVLFISTFVGFTTWLTASAAGVSHDANVWLTIGAFLLVAVILFSYMISCMRRHCTDDKHVV